MRTSAEARWPNRWFERARIDHELLVCARNNPSVDQLQPVFGEGRRLQRLVGACLQLGSLYDTAVYATLDAINRPLGRARFRQVAAFDADERAQA